MTKLIASKAYQNEWNPEVIQEYYNHLHDIAVGEWGYNIYPNQLEIVNAEGMLEAYASIGMPVTYPHWSFGKSYLTLEKFYRRGKMGLAYEMICNSNPAISYLMEENSLTMQVLVMAHACFGHNHFFKNNYLFRQWTRADSIIDYLRYAKHYVEECEEKYGFYDVERILDAAHCISLYSVEKYAKRKITKKQKEEARKRKVRWDEENFDSLAIQEADDAPENAETKMEPTENVLYFIEKNSPSLKEWERELVRIVRKVNEYFYPQMHTQLTNEGFAVWSHHRLVEELDKRHMVDESFMLEFCDKHAGVVYQPDWLSLNYSGRLNPYKIGWEIYKDIERICTEPTKEDEQWFPYMVGQPVMKTVFDAVQNYKNESFIQQYLSPNVIRKMKLFTLLDDGDENNGYYKCTAIQNDEGYKHVREVLASNWDITMHLPQISIINVDWKHDRTMTFEHKSMKNRTLDEREARKVLTQVWELWQFPLRIISRDVDGSENAAPIEFGVHSGIGDGVSGLINTPGSY